MSKIVYDIIQIIGLALIVAGVSFWSGPAALIVAGVLLIAFTILDAAIASRTTGR